MNAAQQKIFDMPVYVVLARKPGENGLSGLIELSFAMDWSAERVNMFWTGTAYSILGKHEIDGREWATDNCKSMSRHHPDWDISVYDAHAEDCPIEIDWDRWTLAMTTNTNKYYKRNAPFTMK
jgi:hypothetical protein